MGSEMCIRDRRGNMRDEELRAVGVRPGVGHRQHAGRIVLEVRVELVGKRVAGAAGAAPFGAARLDHEVGDDAVELQAVVEAPRHEGLKIGHRLRGLVVVELEANRAAIGFDDGNLPGVSLRSAVTGIRVDGTTRDGWRALFPGRTAEVLHHPPWKQ